MAKLRGAKYFGKLDMLQRYWQCPPAEEVQEIFTITNPTSKYTPQRVLQEVRNAVGYIQETVMEILDDLDCEVRVGDIVWR